MSSFKRLVATLTLALVLTGLWLVPVGQAAQRQDGLDTPLLSANNCGSGDTSSQTYFTLAATGDTFPHETIQAVAEKQGYDYLFERVAPFLQAADLAYTNFDGAMLEGSPLSGYPRFNYSPKLATALKKAGIGLVSTANNHILDRTAKGLDATLSVLEQNGIKQHGTVPSSATNQPHPTYLPLEVSRNGVTVKIGFLSFSWGTNGNPDYYDQVNLLWESNLYNQQGRVRQSVLEAIAQARRETDLVVVAAHWGYEYNFYPEEVQLEAARQMAQAGADVILGAQSHTLQPVDILDNLGRKTVVIYSLGNFIAAQAFNQSEKFSDTSVIFYVGFARHSDGKVRVTGYRYLPTLMVDGDIRPAPLPLDGNANANANERVLAHVRQQMRDFNGLRQVSPETVAAVGDHLEVCPSYSFKEAPGKSFSGDFSQYFATLGSGQSVHPLQEALAIVGYPLGKVVQEPSGDCSRITSVLYTERQRLELQPEANWPFRVVGTQLGTEVYRHKYQLREVPRLGEEALTNPQFKAFYQQFGGVVVFGYPISNVMSESESESEEDATTSKQPRMVQYFERARFELPTTIPTSSDPLYQVQLGLLGQEYSGIQSQCPAATTVPSSSEGDFGGWLLLVGLVLVVVGVGVGAWGWFQLRGRVSQA